MPPVDAETRIVAKIRWGRVSASIPIHLGYLWPFLKDGALMFAGQETHPVFVALPSAAVAFGLLACIIHEGRESVTDGACWTASGASRTWRRARQEA